MKARKWKESYAAACSPEPATVELTDILLDNWSMTSVTANMPGRPEVGPWLRGIDDEAPQTTVAWRVELGLVTNHPKPEEALQRIFTKHRVRSHETVTLKTGQVVEDFLKVIPKLKDRPADLPDTVVAVRLSRGKVILRTIRELIDEPDILYAESTLILPDTFGGLNQAGMLDANSVPLRRKDGDPPPPSIDVADNEGYESKGNLPQRRRLLLERSEAGWSVKAVPDSQPLPEFLSADETYNKSELIFRALKVNGYRVRLVEPMAFDNEDAPTRSLVMLAPVDASNSKVEQLLVDHVGEVEQNARAISRRMCLSEDNPLSVALCFAAKWHDEGKKADIWQRFAYGSLKEGQWLG
jgi:CRISPR-associated endonuclease/helicase Cas3